MEKVAPLTFGGKALIAFATFIVFGAIFTINASASTFPYDAVTTLKTSGNGNGNGTILSSVGYDRTILAYSGNCNTATTLVRITDPVNEYSAYLNVIPPTLVSRKLSSGNALNYDRNSSSGDCFIQVTYVDRDITLQNPNSSLIEQAEEIELNTSAIWTWIVFSWILFGSLFFVWLVWRFWRVILD